MSHEVSKTRGYLRSFGASVTNYEDEMLKLIEKAGERASAEDLAEAIRLTENLNRRLVEIIEHVLSIEVELLRELGKRIQGPGGSRV